MTQKLTLPIQVGKKYVRRDGKVVEIARINSNIANSFDSSNAVWDQSGTVWLDGSEMRNEDLVADYIESAAHPHAEAMMEYAKDAAKSETPWENWEVQNYDTNKWYTLSSHPEWKTLHNYRRKPHKVTINGIECIAGVKQPVFDEFYYISSVNAPDYCRGIRYTGAHRRFAERGIMHATEEDAVAMAKAMLAFQTCSTK